MKKFLLPLIFVAAASCVSKKECCKKNCSDQSETVSVNTAKTDSLLKTGYVSGTIFDARTIDGCSFQIKTNNQTFTPIKALDERFQKDSLEVIFKYQISRAMTTCMNGQPIDVLDIHAK